MRVVVVIGDIEVEVPREVMAGLLWRVVDWRPEEPDEVDTVAWLLLGLLVREAEREV